MEYPNLPSRPYDLVYMDPPWSYRAGHQFDGRKITSAASAHYPTLSHADLKNFPIDKFAGKNCLLFMWVTNPHLREGILLGEHWGFDYGTVAFCWEKQRHNPGYWTMGGVELCLGFKRGPFPKDRGARNIRQFFSEKASGHSVKPARVRQWIHDMFPNQSKIELFARGRYPGWDTWGLEVDGRIYNPTQRIRAMNEEIVAAYA